MFQLFIYIKESFADLVLMYSPEINIQSVKA